MDVATLDDGTFADRTVGLRVDLNSPVDHTGTPVDDSRFVAHLETIEELRDRGAAVVVLAHQGRPGRDDFTALSAHASHLGSLLDTDVEYVDTVCSREAREAIRTLDPGELLCLENMRFASEELLDLDPTDPASTHLVDRLSRVLDCYVNDAFAVAHRAQASVVGFPAQLPSFAGRLMEHEISVLGELDATPRPRVALLAGAKVDDALRVARRLLAADLVERVYLGGLVANAMWLAIGPAPGSATARDLQAAGYGDCLDSAAALAEQFGDRIELPLDVVVPDGGDRRVVSVDSFPIADAPPRDVGPATIEAWGAALADAATVICNGPVGRVEDERFATGTAELFTAAARSSYAIAGGGDTSAALRQFDIDGFSHVSTGGGASVTLLSGSDLPGLEALEACSIDQPS